GWRAPVSWGGRWWTPTRGVLAPCSRSVSRTIRSWFELGTLTWTSWRGVMARNIAAKLAGIVWYRSGKEMPSGLGHENQVPDWGSHSAGKVEPISAGGRSVMSRDFATARGGGR